MNPGSVAVIYDAAVSRHNIQERKVNDEIIYYLPNSDSPYSGWLKKEPDGLQKKSLSHITLGRLDGLWVEFYPSGQICLKGTYKNGIKIGLQERWYKNGQRESEIEFDEKGVVTAKKWKPSGELCPETNVVNGNGKAVSYNDDGSPSSISTYKNGKGSLRILEDPGTEKLLDNFIQILESNNQKLKKSSSKKTEESSSEGRTAKEISLRNKIQQAYPSISFDDLKTVVDDIFGEISDTTEEGQRNRILDDILMTAESKKSSKSGALANYKHWRKIFSIEIFGVNPKKFDLNCAKMINRYVTSSMIAADISKKTNADLRKMNVEGFERKNDNRASEIMDKNCAYFLAYNKGYQGYAELWASPMSWPLQLQNDAEDIMIRFERAESRAERYEIDAEAKRFCALHKKSVSPSNDQETPRSEKIDPPTADNSDTPAKDASSNNPVETLTALQVFTSGTLDEAKECVRLLDEQLKNDPENTRIKLVKSTIMDVFRSEASLIAALNGQAEADKQYEIKMNNLRITSKPSALTGKVNTAEVERIRRELAEIKATTVSRINAAKVDLRNSLNSAKHSISAPDSETLSRVWSQIEIRNNL